MSEVPLYLVQVEGTPNVEIAHDGIPSGVRTLTLKRDRGEGLLPVQGRTCPAHSLIGHA